MCWQGHGKTPRLPSSQKGRGPAPFVDHPFTRRGGQAAPQAIGAESPAAKAPSPREGAPRALDAGSVLWVVVDRHSALVY